MSNIPRLKRMVMIRPSATSTSGTVRLPEASAALRLSDLYVEPQSWSQPALMPCAVASAAEEA